MKMDVIFDAQEMPGNAHQIVEKGDIFDRKNREKWMINFRHQRNVDSALYFRYLGSNV